MHRSMTSWLEHCAKTRHLIVSLEYLLYTLYSTALPNHIISFILINPRIAKSLSLVLPQGMVTEVGFEPTHPKRCNTTVQCKVALCLFGPKCSIHALCAQTDRAPSDHLYLLLHVSVHFIIPNKSSQSSQAVFYLDTALRRN